MSGVSGTGATRGGTAHVDTFARDRLPPPELQPVFRFDGLPELAALPERLNCAAALLDARIAAGDGARLCIQGEANGSPVRWTYDDLQAVSSRIAHVLVDDLGLVPGNRVLLRGANTPMLAACWFAVVKAGGIAVGTMPLLRAKELGQIVDKAEVTHALCDARLLDELAATRAAHPVLRAVATFLGGDGSDLETRMAGKPAVFEPVDTHRDDTCLIAFTSGTTGVPKGTMHFHRDVVASCLCWPAHVLRATRDDVFIGSPPLAFTFGLGGLLLFPLHVGASTVLLEKASPEALPVAIARHRATVCFTAPTSYRAMAATASAHDLSSLRKCVSAGEALPAATRALWKQATGIELIDGIGSTEMLHIFVSHDEAHAVPGATGTAVPGYAARVIDDEGRDVPAGTVGRLAVQGPTGCRYLDDPRQAQYVRDGWNLTGDAYAVDAHGNFVYQARTDDMIISGGYNIAGPEVESALLLHPAVAECAVVGARDAERGEIVKAFVVLREGHAPGDAAVRALQDFVKRTIAPYKYPRAIAFVGALPKTETGKLQRFRLKTLETAPVTASGATVLQPPGWAKPKGYANGVAATGRLVSVAGQVGWNAACEFESDDFAAQTRQALANVVAVLAEAGAKPEHIVRMTWYVLDKREYLAAGKAVGAAYRELVGHFGVAMTAVEVRALMEDRAKVEIEVTAVVPA